VPELVMREATMSGAPEIPLQQTQFDKQESLLQQLPILSERLDTLYLIIFRYRHHRRGPFGAD